MKILYAITINNFCMFYYCYIVLHLIFGYMLESVYIKGFGWGPIGGWSSNTNSTVCAHITNTPADFWNHRTEDCSQLIQNRIESIEYIVYAFVYTLLVIIVVLALFLRCVRSTSHTNNYFTIQHPELPSPSNKDNEINK